jgi:hypothetical protein
MTHGGRANRRRGNVSAQEERLGLLYSGQRRLSAQDNHSGHGTDAHGPAGQGRPRLAGPAGPRRRSVRDAGVARDIAHVGAVGSV